MVKIQNIGKEPINIQKRFIIEKIKEKLKSNDFDDDRLRFYWEKPLVEGYNIQPDLNYQVMKILVGLNMMNELITDYGIDISQINFNQSTKPISKSNFLWKNQY